MFQIQFSYCGLISPVRLDVLKEGDYSLGHIPVVEIIVSYNVNIINYKTLASS